MEQAKVAELDLGANGDWLSKLLKLEGEAKKWK